MSQESTEYLQRFGYRTMESHERTGRFRRIWDLIWFEVTSTWYRSTFGKVLLIIILVINGITILVSATASLTPIPEDVRNDNLNSFVATYMVFADNPIAVNTAGSGGLIVSGMGFLIIALLAISGSGLFSDDKAGNVTEVYLSRVRKSEYITGKIGAIVLYSNLFILVPLLVISILNVQSYGANHLNYIWFYFGIVIYGVVTSLFLGLGILVLSITLEKRHYASLGFFVIYFLITSFGGSLYYLDPSNELLVLISPSNLLVLLAFILLGDFDIAIWEESRVNQQTGFPEVIYRALDLNDGVGLEYWHVLLVFFAYFMICSLYLYYRIQKMTTEEL